MNEFESDWISLSQSGEGSVSKCFFVNAGNQSCQGEWVWEQKLRIQDGRIQDGQNSRWPPSSSWVRMNEFESDWISLSQSQSEGRVFLSESERRNTRCLNSTIQKLNPRWQNSRRPNSRWPPSSSWVRMNEWSFFVQMVGREVWVKFFLCKWWEPILASMSVFERKNYDGWIQDGGIQDDRIQHGCHHQVEWEWMSLSQIELVWIRVRVKGECFWVNLREENKVSEFHNAEAESKMAEFKMATIIKLHENEWVWVRMN